MSLSFILAEFKKCCLKRGEIFSWVCSKSVFSEDIFEDSRNLRIACSKILTRVTDEAVISISARVVEMIGIDKRVAALGGSSVIEELFKGFALSWDGRIEPRIDIGMDVDNRCEGTRMARME